MSGPMAAEMDKQSWVVHACYGRTRSGEGMQTSAEHGHGNRTIIIRFDPELCI